MKRSRVVSLKNIGLTDFFKRNIIILMLCLVFILGVFVGTVCYIKNPVSTNLSRDWFNDYISFRISDSFFSVFINSAIYFLTISISVFACGSSMMGTVLVPSLILYLGFRYGLIASYAYSVYELKGIAFNAIILIPPTVMFLIGLFFASKSSVEFSLIMTKLALPKSAPRNISSDFKIYSGKFVILFFVIFLSSIIDASLCRWLIDFFKFAN